MPKNNSGFSSKTEIKKAGEEFCKSPNSKQARVKVQEYREFRLHCLVTTLGIVNKATFPHQCLLSIRLKRLIGIRRKLSREGTNFDLADLDDIIGVRVICRSYNDARELTTSLNTLAEQHNVKDYVQTPNKATGYRAVHHIFRFEQLLSANKPIKVRFEIQVRSYLQHQWAIWSESKGNAAKIGKANASMLAELCELSERVADWENKYPENIQSNLLEYSSAGNSNFSVAWKVSPSSKPHFEIYDSLETAIHQLNYQENYSSLATRHNALLLVGIGKHNENEVKRILYKTHPLFTLDSVPDPKDILRKISNKS